MSSPGLARLCKALLLASCAILAGCSSSTPAESTPPDAAATGGTINLTDQVLTNAVDNCSGYTGNYSSTITNVASEQTFDGQLSISEDDDVCTFESNQIPNHDIDEGPGFVYPLAEVPLRLQLDAKPLLASAPSRLEAGPNAILLNGVRWESFSDACFDTGDEPIGSETLGCGPDPEQPWRYDDASELNSFDLDVLNGHPNAGGAYHYHATPLVLHEIECAGAQISPVIGFAADGFPVYGPCFEDTEGEVRKATSSYQLRTGVRQDVDGYTTPRVAGNVASDDYDGQFAGDYEYVEGSGDLDSCNGMEVDGSYGYYSTVGYPYVLACYSGTPNSSFQ